MGYVLVLVSSANHQPLQQKHLETVSQYLGEQGSWQWLSVGKAAELSFARLPGHWTSEDLEGLLKEDGIDFFLVEPGARRKKKLLVCDMDNTVVVGETLDDLAESCGLGAEIAAITKRAMAGRIDFAEALKTRVRMLKDLELSELEKIRAKIRYTPGAETLVRVMREKGAFCVLVSGGFASFTSAVAEKLGFHAHHSNILKTKDDKLTGEVREPILDHQEKRALLQQYRDQLRITREEILAVGDGANDLAMINAAGFGVGFHPKACLKKKAKHSIVHGDLSTLLYAQGYRDFPFYS
ncbi:MAG: phosphoserine phosphatase SerB [Deltaproteobacteria bacterium]|nr:MAG: phosphoserine phosphatase SerB [Deltaproteobacteria bacterium]